MVNSRDKGKVGEREAAKKLNEIFGTSCRRGQQYSGDQGAADVVGLPGIHLEIKRRERGNVANWIEQSVHDAVDGDVPVVMHRASRRPWLVTVRLADLLELARAGSRIDPTPDDPTMVTRGGDYGERRGEVDCSGGEGPERARE